MSDTDERYTGPVQDIGGFPAGDAHNGRIMNSVVRGGVEYLTVKVGQETFHARRTPICE